MPRSSTDSSGIIIPIYADDDNHLKQCSQLDLARALLTALEGGAYVINISGGQFSTSGEPEPLLLQAITNAEIMACSSSQQPATTGVHVCTYLPLWTRCFLLERWTKTGSQSR